MAVATFGIVGSGFRAEYFLRLARLLPDRFRVGGIVVRDPARAAAITSEWGVVAHPSQTDLLAGPRPDFLVLAATRAAAPALLAEAAAAEMPVLAETPPAADLAGLLRVWALVRAGARIQVAEQYPLSPWHAARLALARSGRLGTISQAQVSVAHGYHGIALLRQLLGTGFAPARVTARRFTSPMVEGPQRRGPPTEHRQVASEQVIAQLDWGDRLGIHDFASGQYRSWIRAPRLLVRGERGEILNEEVRWLNDFRTPVAFTLRRHDTGTDAGPEDYGHRAISGGGEVWYQSPFPGVGLSDDQIAGAAILAGMVEYLAGGPEPYPLAQAAEDQYLALCVEQACASGGLVTSERQPWAG